MNNKLNPTTNRKILSGSALLMLIINFGLWLYGVTLHSFDKGSNPFLFPWVFLPILIINLPMAYDFYLIQKGRPLSIIGSYLNIYALWSCILLEICLFLICLIIQPGFCLGIGVLTVFGLYGIVAGISNAYGLPLLFWLQVFFWIFIAPWLIFPETGIIHADLRKSWLAKFLFITFLFLYLVIGFFVAIALTAWLIPPSSAFWDSWMFN